MSTKVTVAMTATFDGEDEEELDESVYEAFIAAQERFFRRRKATHKLKVPVYSHDNQKIGQWNIEIEKENS